MIVPTALAMQIAEVNRLRFNEMVAANHYKFAPTATYLRAPRMFDLSDMLGLCAFGDLVRLRLSYPLSAEIASEVVQNHRSYGDELEDVVYAVNNQGEAWLGPWFGEGKAKNRPNLNPEAGHRGMSVRCNIGLLKGRLMRRYAELGGGQ